MLNDVELINIHMSGEVFCSIKFSPYRKRVGREASEGLDQKNNTILRLSVFELVEIDMSHHFYHFSEF